MSMEKLNSFFEKLERRLDSFFAIQQGILGKLLDTLFGYAYKENSSGLFGLFDSPEKLRQAAIEARKKGYRGFDCLSPFPIHGLELDMGLERSRIPYITFFAGVLGLIVGFALQTIAHENVLAPLLPYFDGFPNLRSYPLNIGGKPTFSWPAMVPICFELTVLIGGHSTVLGLLLLAGMYRPFRRILHPDITNDKFCLWIPSDSPGYEEKAVVDFLKELQAFEITLVSPEEMKPA